MAGCVGSMWRVLVRLNLSGYLFCRGGSRFVLLWAKGQKFYEVQQGPNFLSRRLMPLLATRIPRPL